MASGRKGRDEVSDERSEAVRQVVGEVARHLAWLRDAGVREVPGPGPLTGSPPAAVRPPPPRSAEAGRAVDAAPRVPPPAAPPAPTVHGPAPVPGPAPAGEKGCGSPALQEIR